MRRSNIVAAGLVPPGWADRRLPWRADTGSAMAAKCQDSVHTRGRVTDRSSRPITRVLRASVARLRLGRRRRTRRRGNPGLIPAQRGTRPWPSQRYVLRRPRIPAGWVPRGTREPVPNLPLAGPLPWLLEARRIAPDGYRIPREDPDRGGQGRRSGPGSEMSAPSLSRRQSPGSRGSSRSVQPASRASPARRQPRR
jgi:hypothetical protein